MTPTVTKANWLIWVLLALLLVSAPIPTLVLCAAVFLSYKLTKSDRSFRDYLVALSCKIDLMTLAIACAVAFATTAIGFQDANARHMGFPATFISYYNFSGTPAQPIALWQQLAINPLQFLVDAALYYCAIRLAGRLWQQAKSR